MLECAHEYLVSKAQEAMLYKNAAAQFKERNI